MLPAVSSLRWPLTGLIAFLVAFGLLASRPAIAQDEPAVSKAEIEKLVKTLEDDKARAKLLGQLKALSAANRAVAPEPEKPVGDAILSAIPNKIEESFWSILARWSGGAADYLSKGLPGKLVGSAISIGFAFLTAWIIWRLVAGSIDRYLNRTDHDGNAVERSQRMRTLLPLARLVVRVVLTVMVTLILLSEVGVNIAPLLAGAGVVGIAVGFGAQKLVQDIITGVFILVEDTISVGDVVRIDPHAGVVESMSIRAVRLRDANGNLHSIPFSSVDAVVNMSRGFAFALFEIGVAYREDIDHVMQVVVDLAAEMRADPEWSSDIVEPLEMNGLDRFDASAVVIRARFMTKPLRQWAVSREFNRRLKRRFDELGIEIPFPQTTVWLANSQDAPAKA
jgi:small conductance mechanosensitive channel